MAFIDDPAQFVQQRVKDLNRTPVWDDQEVAEREQAAKAYSKESPQHYVDYCMDCIDVSVRSAFHVREVQNECWRIFNEEEPPNYSNKEPWQSRVVVPKPFGSIQFAQAIVRKAFDAEFLSIENEQDPDAAIFWEKIMYLMLSRNYGKFARQFTDATGMGFAIGTSMEMIPVWRPKEGLRFVLVEPWKIHRDPDAVSREPQSGMWWIHQEYLDYWLLKQYEKDKRYKNIPTQPEGQTDGQARDNYNLTQQQIMRRKDMYWQRSKFRTMVLTSEFWGNILDTRGELLLQNATYTIAADKVIREPVSVPYSQLRWPGVSFSPVPHFLRHDGRGLLQGVRTLWYFMSSLLCLYNDYMNWVVNPPTEIDITSLVNPTDIDDMPGKIWLTRGSQSGQQVVRTIDRVSRTNDILATVNSCNMMYEEGVMVNSVVKGLPGFRAEVTAREAAQQLDQSMTVFGLMGSNLEDGALSIIEAAADTVAINMTYDECVIFLGKEFADKYKDPNSKTGLKLPELSTGAFHVSGVSSLMRDYEMVKSLSQLIIPLFEQPVFQPYTKPYALCKALEERLNLRDEGLFVDEATAARVTQSQQALQEQQIQDAAAQSSATTEQGIRSAQSMPVNPDQASGMENQAPVVEMPSNVAQPQGIQ